MPLSVGIDVGSVSVDIVVADDSGRIVSAEYIRHRGHPMEQAAAALRKGTVRGEGI